MKTILSTVLSLTFCQFAFCQDITVAADCPEYTDGNGVYKASSTPTNDKTKYSKNMDDCRTFTSKTDCPKPGYEIEWDNSQWVWSEISHRCKWYAIDSSCRALPTNTKITIATKADDTSSPVGLTDWSGDCSPIITGETMGVSDVSMKSNLSYYPNPSKGVFNLDFIKPYESLEVTVINELGQMVMSQSYKDKASIQLDIKNQNDGVYYIKLVSNDKKETVIKLIKSNK